MVTFPAGKLYIDGAFRDAASGRTFDDINPWTDAVIAQIADAGPGDIEAAIVAARRAFDETDWSTDRDTRFALVSKLVELLIADSDRLAEIARYEGGASVGAANSHCTKGALDGAEDLLREYAHVKWQEDRGIKSAYGSATQRTIVYEPIGVVGAITPWNVPLYINVGKVIAALLAGCTIVLKPAPDTPLMAIVMAELAHEAGIPAGVFNVIPSADPALAGEMLVTDKRVDLISFTGSTAIGKRIMEKGASTLKRVFLELGGKSASILLDDTPDFAMKVARALVIFHAGQGCAYPTRLLVPRSRYDEAVAVLEKAYAGYADQWGDFESPTNVMGPLISRKQQERVLDYIKVGQQEGARLLAGGKARPDKGAGFFVEPTCFVDVTNDMRIAREEIFGPVLVVIAFQDDEDAIRIANDSDYGLFGLVNGSPERAARIAARLRSGQVSVNGGIAITGDLPFGGYKQSGVGREWGREGIEEFLESKVIGTGIPA
jgi:aldehyde dehydrogenase (NAD+)